MPEGPHAILSRLRHAFAVEPAGPAATTPEERELVDRVCRQIVRRRLVTPALMALEMGRSMNFLGSQVMRFFQPFVGAVLPTDGYERWAGFLEKRGSVDTLRQRLEELEATQLRADRPAEQRGPDSPGEDARARD